MGGDNQHRLPHAAKGWPTEDIANVVVRFSPVVYSPTQPLPILLVVVFVVIVVFVFVMVVIEQALPLVFPTSPPLPLPSRHRPRLNASVNPAEALTCMTPGLCAGCQSHGWPYRPPIRSRSNNCLPPYFPSAFLLLSAWVALEGGGGSGVTVVCAVVVGGGCGCGGGVSRYYLDKNDNFACHVIFAG